MSTLLQKTNPLTYQMLIKTIEEDINREKEKERAAWQGINRQLIGAEIIYVTDDSFYLYNPDSLKRFVVNVGQWQMRAF